MPDRMPLLIAIHNYAASYMAGKETYGSHPETTALYIELDKYEYAVIEETEAKFKGPQPVMSLCPECNEKKVVALNSGVRCTNCAYWDCL